MDTRVEARVDVSTWMNGNLRKVAHENAVRQKYYVDKTFYLELCFIVSIYSEDPFSHYMALYHIDNK